MASTLASSIQKSFKYDVFLSFRGVDTRKNFVDHLYHALKQNSIITYKDDEEIKKGKRISDELIKSIEESKFYIIVFSKNYASSSWCLDELVKIMECQKMNEHTAFPVFYDVEPTEVRNQSGTVGEAFAKHVNAEAARRWRDALKEAASLAGWELKNTFDGHEAKIIQKIVEEISLELRFTNPSIDGKLIGMETRVKYVVSSLETDTEDFRMIGIWGMGGAGKTTLARAVFDQISFMFEGSSFVENVREISKNLSCGLKSLQKQVLSDVLNDQNIIVRGVSDLKKKICGRKVLVVLDDVDQLDQLEALAGEPNWFKLGSRVIITTREEQVLVAHGVPKNLILDVGLLTHVEANCLFNKYAFGRVVPNQGYQKLACQVVQYAAGLPLTIKVLGSNLRGKDEIVWKDALERLKTIPLKATLEKLEISYDSLEEDHKEIFLNVACMLKGWEKEKAIRALESCELHAIYGLKVLEQKSLITVSNSGRLSMHDHIEEMGKHIVRRLHPNEPHKHSRLWIKEETRHILVEDKGTETTRYMKVRMFDPLLIAKGFRKMKELRYLDVIYEEEDSFESDDCDFSPLYNLQFDDPCYSKIGEGSLYLPSGLRYLRWNGPFTCLPIEFEANNLVGLEMRFSNINQLWEGRKEKVLEKLRFIDLYCCVLSSLDIEHIPNLEWLNLDMCSLVEVQMPVKNFSLRYLNLHGSLLRTLDLELAQNLETLKVDSDYLTELRMPVESQKLKYVSLRCSRLKTLNHKPTQNYLETLDIEHEHLVELHMLGTLDLGQADPPYKLNIESNDDLVELHFPVEKHKCLRLQCSKMKTLNLRRTQNLEALDLVKCKDLLQLHMPIASPELENIKITCSKLRTLDLTRTRNLKKLDLILCEDLVELHMPIESPKLKTIKVRCSKLRTLNLTGARNLKQLDLEQCEDLLELHMPIESPKLKTIKVQWSKLRTLCLGLYPYLKGLDLQYCFDLVEIHAPIGWLSGCVKFKSFGVNPGFSMVGSLGELHLIARSIGICPLHPDNNLPKFHFECNYKELLLPSPQNLAKLISFSLCACTNLAGLSGVFCGLQCLRKLTLEGSIPEVPKELDQLECLKELTLLKTDIELLPDSICTLRHLKFLQVESCQFLKQLPEDLGRLECLEELHLKDCKSLLNIPNSICEMKRLKCFRLIRCIRVKKLPREIGCLPCLKDTYIEGTGIIDPPESLFQMKGQMLFIP